MKGFSTFRDDIGRSFHPVVELAKVGAMGYVSVEELEAGLDHILGSPADDGRLEMIVRRPAEDAREILGSAELDPLEGLVGDTWRARGNRHTADGSADPLAQVTLMNARVADLVAVERDRWPLAGDQLYVDMDLAIANLPPGIRLAIGSATLEISDKAHTGCEKFAARFGSDARRFVNTPKGRSLNLRGVNARVVVAGTVSVGDAVRKVRP
jgi:MOSC domain